MATYCDTCGGVPEFHTGGQCWCEDFCDCTGYVEGGQTIPDSGRSYMVASCRHCKAPMSQESASWFTENYCATCEWYMGDITSMLPGESVRVDFRTQPFGGFCESNGCRVCEPYYSEEPIYHVCYEDGGCYNCERGIPRQLPMPDYMKLWKCNGCKHNRTEHAQDGYCFGCRRLHRKRCWSYIMAQPKRVTKRQMARTAKRIAEARDMIVTVLRAPLPETGEVNA